MLIPVDRYFLLRSCHQKYMQTHPRECFPLRSSIPLHTGPRHSNWSFSHSRSKTLLDSRYSRPPFARLYSHCKFPRDSY